MPLTRIKSAGATGGYLTSVTANDLPAGSVLQMLENRTGSFADGVCNGAVLGDLA